MCFSPSADVAAAGVIAVVAVASLRRADHPRTLPLAALPGVFAAQTLSSAFIWWGADGTVSAGLGDAAALFFMAVAYVALPVLVPVAVVLLEPRGWRRDGLLILVAAGAVAAAVFGAGLADGRGGAEACGAYIAFLITDIPDVAAMSYAAATCGALLLSSHRPLLLWGLANAGAVAALLVLTRDGLPSLWCFWAACTSGLVLWFLVTVRAERERGSPWPWEEPELMPRAEMRL